LTTLSALDLHWLDAAVEIASPFLGTTAENPTVGALVVDEAAQQVLGQGITARGGRPHAEPQALEAAGERARGSTLYVTLEPCNHWGRTPPCVDAVIRASIRRVVVGLADPDPRTAGEGNRRMVQAGIEVVVADHAPSRKLHEGFISRVERGQPFVTAKLAVSADGMIGRPLAANVPITGEAARAFTHLQRATSDAVMIGGSTANIDDPRLSVRLDCYEDRMPLRVVLAGNEPLRTDLTLFAKDTDQPTVVIGLEPGSAPSGVTFWRVPGLGRPALPDVLKVLADHGIGRLLVEGGTALTEALLNERLVDRFLLLTSPLVIGPDGQSALVRGPLQDRIALASLTLVDQHSLGDDNVRTFERS
jgi:diaminohydroxyphosphoribosylaminopyrimidine deaminase/5-amino-6-(5-phosphoribosylamino)uracil reductase